MKCNGFNRSRLAAFSIAAAVAALVGLQGQLVNAADSNKANENSAAAAQKQNAAHGTANADRDQKAADEDQVGEAGSNENANSPSGKAESKESKQAGDQQQDRAQQNRSTKDKMARENRRGNERDEAAERRGDRSEPRREIRNYRPDNSNADQSKADQADRDREGRATRNGSADRDRSNNRGEFGISFSGDGLVVGRIAGDSLAQRARLRKGDEIVSINGHRVSSSDEFDRWVNDVDRGDAISIVVLRDGRRETLRVEPQDQGRVNYNQDPEADRNGPAEVAYLGVLLDERDEDGAMVQSVQPGSPADDAGLRQGDVIRSFNGQRVRSADELAALVGRTDPGSTAEIEYTRRQSGMVNVELGAKPARGQSQEEDRRFSRDPNEREDQSERLKDSGSRNEADYRGPQNRGDLQQGEGADLRSGDRSGDSSLRNEDAGRLRMRRDNGGLLPRLRNRNQ